jgi:ribbon-helix-helix protein
MTEAFSRQNRRHDDSSASSLAIHNVVVAGHRTSVRLEPVMWEALRDIARQRRMSLTAAIRVYIVNFYRAAAIVSGQPPTERLTRAHA